MFHSKNSKNHWITKYLDTLHLKNIIASTAKRASAFGSEQIVIRSFFPSPLAHAVQYIFTNLSGSLSKELVLYCLNNKEHTDSIECLVIPIPEEDLKALDKAKKTQDWKTFFARIKHVGQNSVRVGLHNIVTLSYADFATNAGATMGSLLAQGVFFGMVGPPSLLTAPLYFLTEGSIKSLSAFLGNQLCRQNTLHAEDPIFLDALTTVLQKMHIQQEEQEDYECQTIDGAEQSDLLQSWELFKTPIPKVQQNEQFAVIDDYKP
ncbi:MAG TPA: hypothetical protein VFP93_02980 [Gammaproteobacteria bacterium]|nr:hypothetical protein [Gammaproteobacteria bacterium]